MEGIEKEAYDDHCWLVADGVAWKIYAVRPSILFLWRGYEPNIDTAIVHTSGIDWDKYNTEAVRRLENYEACS